MTNDMPSRRFNFEKLTVALAIPIILLIAVASALMLVGAVTDNRIVRAIGNYSSIPIFAWTAVPLLAPLFVVLIAVLRKAVQLFKPEAFAREIAPALEYVPTPRKINKNQHGSLSDEEILKLLLEVPDEPLEMLPHVKRVDWTAAASTDGLLTKAESVIPPDSGIKVVEVARHDSTLAVNSDFEQVCVENLRDPGDTKKLVLMWRTVNEVTFAPICDFLVRVISGALDVGAELKDRLRVFIPWRDELVAELWKRLATDNEAMKRLGAADVYQLLPIVMEMCLRVPTAA